VPPPSHTYTQNVCDTTHRPRILSIATARGLGPEGRGGDTRMHARRAEEEIEVQEGIIAGLQEQITTASTKLRQQQVRTAHRAHARRRGRR
jgi:hypothetical protein